MPGPLEQELFSFIHQIRRIKASDISLEGVSSNELLLLVTLKHSLRKRLVTSGEFMPGVRASELREKSGLSPSALSHVLRGMEDKGYIQRLVLTKDRRKTYLTLTAAGDAVYERGAQKVRGLLSGMVAEIGPREVQQFLQTGQKMIELYKRQTQAASGDGQE